MRSLRLFPLICLLLSLLGSACGKGADAKCDAVLCGQHGSCVNDKCQCAPGFSGTTCSICAPQCTGKQCGDNGCGGTCGTCPGGAACSANGQCACTPRCSGKVCGDDGCGGTCGMCPGTQACTPAGQCCTPNCTGKACGVDGCGGLCGRCANAQACIMGACGTDNGLACVQRPDTCDTDGDCGGPPNRCVQAPVMKCGNPPTDCGTPDTICRSVLQCWRSCTTDADCLPNTGKTHCLDGFCQACTDDSQCTGGLHCVNNNARDRCAGAGDCTGVALNLCR